MAVAVRPLPSPTAVTRPFWDAAREGRLLIQRCSGCGGLQFYPRPFCLRCLADDMGWQESAGLGRIYTFTVNHRPANEFMSDKVPYVIAVVTLDEGVRMFGQVMTRDTSAVQIGARVRVHFPDVAGGERVPAFELTTQ